MPRRMVSNNTSWQGVERAETELASMVRNCARLMKYESPVAWAFLYYYMQKRVTEKAARAFCEKSNYLPTPYQVHVAFRRLCRNYGVHQYFGIDHPITDGRSSNWLRQWGLRFGLENAITPGRFRVTRGGVDLGIYLYRFVSIYIQMKNKNR